MAEDCGAFVPLPLTRAKPTMAPIPTRRSKTAARPRIRGRARLLPPEARDGAKDGAGICWVGAPSCADGETRAPHTPQKLSPAATMFPHRAQ